MTLQHTTANRVTPNPTNVEQIHCFKGKVYSNLQRDSECFQINHSTNLQLSLSAISAVAVGAAA